ncbi:hypothetical protein CANARDRAFT_27942 [[Candida] arabinofermentans NRRL YB-2248]|uniref:Vps72/YL1 C-terminal domain-containing protein n=1 Tax=[Candida] arabinofermentans NRRL YB-2248 TaxID=983967 RepID=A0A1E4T2A7_9ASCO|nr:hypothetical protein CANARDRAFT_27942 [[Candida] arabinofermentans NRRL YB-2248]
MGSTDIDLVAISDKLTKPQPFKASIHKNKKRHKPQRQILNDEFKRVQQKQLESNTHDPNIIYYHSLNAPPSLKPIKKYCDVTGLPSNYKSPHNQLRYYDKECYDIVKHMAPGVDQQYLALRGANVILK